MATTPKSGNRTTKRGRTPAKPATIDLEAKDVSKASAAKKPAPAKSKTENQQFGRNASAKTTGSTKSPEPKPAPKPEPSTKTAQTKPETSMSGLKSGLIGAAAAVFGLGIIGQFSFAPHIPLLGSIYSDGAQETNTAEQLAILNARIDELAAEQNSAAATDNVEISTLNQKITNLETGLTEANNNDASERLGTIEQEFSKLETQIAELSARPASELTTENNSDSSPAFDTKIAELNDRITFLANSNIQPLENNLDTLQAELTALQEEVTKNSGGINSINTLAGRLDEEIEKISTGNKVAQNVAVNALGLALQNDENLTSPISSLEALSGRTDETSRLAELSRDGIASLNQLNNELDAIIYNVGNPAVEAESGSITDKLWANARSLVTVRSSGPREGDSASAILSRVKENLNNRDLGAVKAEWKKLPLELSDQHKDWIAKVDKRAEAFALHQKISDKFSNPAG